ncbi:MAG: carbohydrate ABC transporter permease [Candidatus Faecivicinus sp.]
MNGRKIGSFFTYAFLTIGVLLILFPMYITVVTSMKTPDEMSGNFFGLPSSFYMGNFVEVINKAHFSSFVINSLLITLMSLAGIAIFVPLVSYAIARNFRKRYYRAIYVLFIAGAFVPFTVVMVPQIKLMSGLNAMNMYGLVLLYWVFALSEGCLLTVSYVNSIPRELDEAAFIDGASVPRTFFVIIYPMMKPIVSAVLIMDALWIWNDFQLPLLMLNASEDMWTLPLFEYNFKNKYSTNYTLAFAAFLLSSLPILAFYLAAQKQIIDGLTNGALKS